MTVQQNALSLTESASQSVLHPALRHAWQPIVDMQNGVVYGFEALLRGYQAAGYPSIQSVFDSAYEADEIVATELALYERAMRAFRAIPEADGRKLFLNIDGRLFDDPHFDVVDMVAVADKAGIPRSSISLELSEQHKTASAVRSKEIVNTIRAAGMRIALDDFGQGFSELKLLYAFAPECVKIDRFFVSGIAQSARKRLFVSTVVNLAHVLGAVVVAEGVETAEDFEACRRIGCDLAQGYFIMPPINDPAEIRGDYSHLRLSETKRRNASNLDAELVRSEIEGVLPLEETATLPDVFVRFRDEPDQTMFPVVDASGEPRGLIHERDFRAYIYNQFGRDILSNRTYGKHLRDFTVRAPVVDMTTAVEKIIETFAGSSAADGVIVTEGRRYVGLLSSTALLKIMNEKRLMAAQDQNPLSHLPGNSSIAARIAAAAANDGATRAFCYFDINHFKPFNDAYGFRLGDRAIMLFADILKRSFTAPSVFLGHIGGDDFFIATETEDRAAFRDAVRGVAETFRTEIESFYEPKHRASGGIQAIDRHGTLRDFPLMSCSVAVLYVPAGRRIDDFDRLGRHIAAVKNDAKSDPSGFAECELEATEVCGTA